MAWSELDRLVHALLLPGFTGLTVPAWLERRAEAGLGGVVLFARNVADPDQLTSLTARLHEARPGLLIAVDEEGGDITRLEATGGSRHPGALALGRIDDVALTRRVGASTGAMLDGAGIDWCWAPVADINTEAANPAIGARSFGDDAALVARHAAAMVVGLQEDSGILACAKHFPGHGATTTDSHRDLPVVTATLDELRTWALEPFRSCIGSGVAAVMTGHLRVLALDEGSPATLSHAVVTGMLRDELGFTGAVVSDALEMAGVADHCGIEEGAVRAVLAGVDALCLGGHLADEDVVDRVHLALVAAVRSGRLGEARLVQAGSRVEAMSSWRAARTGRGAHLLGADEARDIASRAMRVRGGVHLGPGDPVVVTCEPEPLVAAGPCEWGVATAMRAVRPGTLDLRISGPEAATGLVLPPGRPVVIVVRDAGRHPWQLDVVHLARITHPDVVVVELGLPAGPVLDEQRLIRTYGTSRGTIAAVTEALTGPTTEETR